MPGELVMRTANAPISEHGRLWAFAAGEPIGPELASTRPLWRDDNRAEIPLGMAAKGAAEFVGGPMHLKIRPGMHRRLQDDMIYRHPTVRTDDALTEISPTADAPESAAIDLATYTWRKIGAGPLVMWEGWVLDGLWED